MPPKSSQPEWDHRALTCSGGTWPSCIKEFSADMGPKTRPAARPCLLYRSGLRARVADSWNRPPIPGCDPDCGFWESQSSKGLDVWGWLHGGGKVSQMLRQTEVPGQHHVWKLGEERRRHVEDCRKAKQASYGKRGKSVSGRQSALVRIRAPSNCA